MPSYKTSFNDSWLQHPAYSGWLKTVKNSDYKAYCTRCKKDFDISSMGESALKSHMKSKKHSGFEQTVNANLKLPFKPVVSAQGQSSKSIPNQSDSESSCSITTVSNTGVSAETVIVSSQPVSASTASITTTTTTAPVTTPSAKTSSVETAVAINEQILRAQVLWVLKAVSSHYSFNSCRDIGNVLRLMFPGNEVAKNFSCGADKCAYITAFGLGPHFQSILVNRINSCDEFVMLFDESLNGELGTKQLDLHFRFWDCNQVVTRYFSSVFLGHATAADMLSKVKSALETKFTLANLLQVSMDGPAVNWKFHSLLTDDLCATVAQDFRLLDIGSCGLHTVHNAFKAGHSATGWSLGSFFSSLTWLFKDTPARREDFTQLTGCETFPLDYCSHRWVENIGVAERALLIWPHVKTFLQHQIETKSLKTKSFDCLVRAMEDELLEAKVENFISVAKILQPFLKKYQSDAPLVPYLAQDLYLLVKTLLQRFLTSETIKSLTPQTTLKLDVEDKKVYLPYTHIDIGFKAKQQLKSTKASQKGVLSFRVEAREFLKATVKKILEKSPLKSKLLRSLRWLDPEIMRSDPDLAVNLCEQSLACLVSLQKIKAEDVDVIKQSLNMWLGEYSLPTFDSSSERLDIFFHNHLSEGPQKLWTVVRKLLTLSHGQAQVERGFSINKETMIQNMAEHTAIAKRIICDHVSSVGGVCNVEISPKLISCVSSARASYRQYLDEKKEEVEKARKRRARDDKFEAVEAMKKKKRRLEEEITSLESNADKLADKAENLNAMKFLVQSNALRASAKRKKVEVFEISEKVEAAVKEIAGL